MKIYGRNLAVKLGQCVPRMPALNELVDPCLVIWHGKPDAAVVSILDGSASRWVLCVSASSLDEELEVFLDGKVVRFPGRLRGLTWGLGNLPLDPTTGTPTRLWEEVHSRWKVQRIKDFLKATGDTQGEPPWHLLRPPNVPEHILACYLCALGEIEPVAAWQAGYEDEVSFGREQDPAARLTWDDRQDVARLREFLVSTQLLLEHSNGVERCDDG